MKAPIIVLGLGNPLMADEGIGTKLIEKLDSACGDYARADFIDAGTGGMTVLTYIAGREKAIIIDCALMGTEPGTIKRFTADEVVSVKKLSHLSQHDSDIINVIELSKQLGECPDEVVFFGIEPQTIDQTMKLTELIESKLDDYVAMILKEVRSTS